MTEVMTVVCPNCKADVITGSFESLGVDSVKCHACGEVVDLKQRVLHEKTSLDKPSLAPASL